MRRCGIVAPSAAVVGEQRSVGVLSLRRAGPGLRRSRPTSRSIKADDFFTGMFSTALEQGEIITAVELPIPQKSAYEKFRNPASRYAIVGVFVAKFADGVRLAITGAGQDGVFRQKEMEQALSAQFLGGRDRRHQEFARWAERRYPCQRGVSRPPDRCCRAARGGKGSLNRRCGGSATMAVLRSTPTSPGDIGAGSGHISGLGRRRRGKSRCGACSAPRRWA